MELDLQKAIEILATDSENEEIDELTICFARQKLAIEEIIAKEERGNLKEEEADTAIASVITEAAQEHLDIFDLKIEPVEAIDMSASNNGLISFSQAIGNTLANLIESEFQTPEAGISAIMQNTGLNEDRVRGIISGKVVPDTATADAIAQTFAALQNEETYKQWIALSSQAIAEATGKQDLAESSPALIAMAAENNQLKAEFAAMKQQQDLAEELRILEKRAERLVTQGFLTPFERQQLLGNESEREDSLALFSQSCAANQVPVDVQLDRIQYYLHVASNRGQVVQFSDNSEIVEFENNLAPEDRDYADEFFRNNRI